MLPLKALGVLLLGASNISIALASPVATPGEVEPVEGESEEGTAEWYCQWRGHSIYDSYTLTGKNWGVNAHDIRKKIGSNGKLVTKWSYEGSDYEGFAAKWALPVGMSLRVEDDLANLIKGQGDTIGAHGFICHRKR